jgi:hypothetical protein
MDLIYMFRDAQPAYESYRDLDHLDDSNGLLSTAAGDNPQEYMADLDRLRG